MSRLLITFSFAVLVAAMDVLPAGLSVGQPTIDKVRRMDMAEAQVLDGAVLAAKEIISNITKRDGIIEDRHLVHIIHDKDRLLESLLPLLETAKGRKMVYYGLFPGDYLKLIYLNRSN